MFSTRAFAVAFLSSLMFAAVADAKPRVVVAFDEAVDGKATTVREVESSVMQKLSAKGYRIISGKIAEQVRKAQAADFAKDGKVPEALSAIDADFMLVGKAESNHFGSLDAVSVHSYRSNVTIYLVRVDTGEIVSTLKADGAGESFGKSGAARSAMLEAAEGVSAQVIARLQGLESAPKIVDVTLYGVPDRKTNKKVKTALRGVAGIKKVTARTSAQGVSKLELEVDTDTETLGDRLEGNGMPFEVVRTSPGAILLRFDPRRSLSLGVTIPKPRIKLSARHKYLQKALPKLFEAEMENMPYLSSVNASRSVPKRGAKRVVKAMAKRHKTPLVLATEVTSGKGDNIVVTARVFDKRGKKLLEHTETGAECHVAELVQKISAHFDEELLSHLADSSERTLVAASEMSAPMAPLPMEAGMVHIGDVELENIFPAKIESYRTEHAGSVKVALSGDVAAKDVRVRVFVPGYMALPTEVVLKELKPGQSEVDLKMAFDAKKLLDLDDNLPAQAQVEVEARLGASKTTDRRIVPVMLYGRNAIDWGRGALITSFVTPQEQTVVTLARQAVQPVVNKDATSSMKSALLLFDALRGFKYVKDPVRPAKGTVLDTVQFARETLKYRTGDCDDLSVLYASLLESVGVETAIVLLPGHVLVGVAPGTGVDGIGQITVDPDRYFVHDDKVFIPVETTLVGKSFSKAWASGAEEVARWKKEDKVEVLVVREGWDKNPPAPLPKASVEAKKLMARLNKVEGEIDVLAALREEGLSKRETVLAKSDNASEYAWLLTQKGEFDKAETALRASLKKDKTHAAVHHNLGNVLLLKGETQAAVGAFRTAEKLPQSQAARAKLLGNLGVAYYLMGDERQAKRAMLGALDAGDRSLAKSVGIDDNSRSADKAKAKTVAERELQSLLLKALADDAKKKGASKSKKLRFQKALASGGRRGDDPESRKRLVDLLRWSR